MVIPSSAREKARDGTLHHRQRQVVAILRLCTSKGTCDSTLSLLSSAKAGGGNSSSERAEARDGTLSSSAAAGGGTFFF